MGADTWVPQGSEQEILGVRFCFQGLSPWFMVEYSGHMVFLHKMGTEQGKEQLLGMQTGTSCIVCVHAFYHLIYLSCFHIFTDLSCWGETAPRGSPVLRAAQPRLEQAFHTHTNPPRAPPLSGPHTRTHFLCLHHPRPRCPAQGDAPHL